MRRAVLIAMVIMALLLFLVEKQLHLAREIKALREERAQVVQPPTSHDRTEINLKQSQPAEPTRFPSENELQMVKRMLALESQVNTLQNTLSRASPGPLIPEYDPTNPGFEPTIETNTPGKRSWGTEQVLGPPDTERVGDAVTAWATMEATAGHEWLAVGFERAVDIAQVRIRETYNPGAISKVTAMVNGSEVVLWEGTARSANTLRDFVVPVFGSVMANSIMIHLDTTRVKSWAEIDAVELVGRDGSRQWASSAKASSTYADKTQSDKQISGFNVSP